MRDDCSCNEFSRAHVLRGAVAHAGNGLPAIEPGMPMPAGTGLSRRSLLARGAGLALAVYGADRLGLGVLEQGMAEAAQSDRILVSVFLDGGADALSILFPTGDPQYRVLRPRLALPENAGTAFAEDARLRWHPAASAFATLHGEGKLSVLPAVGYTNADQSHFTSRHYWEVGATDAQLATGWLGRYLDVVGSASNPLQGLSLQTRLQPSLATAKVPVAALSGPSDYVFSAPNGGPTSVQNRMLDSLRELGADGAADPALRTAAAVTRQAMELRGQLTSFAGAAVTSPVTYPSSSQRFPTNLRSIAAMIAGGLPLRCVALDAPGSYDTHASQTGTLQTNLQLAADSLLAFQRDLEARGLADRVLTLVWSEFGRRAKENASDGTDHGAAGLGFVVGTRATGKMIGEFPGLAQLDERGNLRATSDYRALYSSLLEQWLQTDARGIIPDADKFARLAVVR
jgi:uncharacterized protein (DUF1501 family)